MLQVSQDFRRSMAERTALPMFCLSLLYLVTVATVLVVWVDVLLVHGELKGAPEGIPAVLEESQREDAASRDRWTLEETAFTLGYDCLILLGLLWPVFALEFVAQFVTRDKAVPFWRQRYFGLIICLCPPLRLCARNHDMDGKVWLPSLGWQEVDDPLRDRLEKIFSVPMIVIALMILPVLLVDLRMQQQAAISLWLRILVHVSTGVIWFAFAAEFIVMVSVAEKKLRYCKQHWLDLAIILLPLISFLRSLRVVRAMRLARVAKIQQLTRMSRIYRLRGLAMRGFRALLLLKLFNRLFRIAPERQLRKLKGQLQEKEKELAVLRRLIAELEDEVAKCKEAKPVPTQPPARET